MFRKSVNKLYFRLWGSTARVQILGTHTSKGSLCHPGCFKLLGSLLSQWLNRNDSSSTHICDVVERNKATVSIAQDNAVGLTSF